jgi:hypothetical protein
MNEFFIWGWQNSLKMVEWHKITEVNVIVVALEVQLLSC